MQSLLISSLVGVKSGDYLNSLDKTETIQLDRNGLLQAKISMSKMTKTGAVGRAVIIDESNLAHGKIEHHYIITKGRGALLQIQHHRSTLDGEQVITGLPDFQYLPKVLDKAEAMRKEMRIEELK